MLLSGCNQPPPPPQMKPPAVTVAEPVVKQVVFNEDFTGTLASVASVDIRARVAGFLEKIDFQPSDNVKKGQLLFVIQQDEYQAALDKANAQQKAADAQLVDAQATLDRYTELLKKQAVTPQDVNDATAARDKAQAAVLGAKADVEQAQINMGYTTIKAPINGKISRNLVDVGNLVGSGENTLLTSIVTMDPIYVYFDASERLWLQALKKKRSPTDKDPLQVHVGLSDEEGYPHTGTIDFANNKIDPGTGTIQVRAVLENKEGYMYPGLYVRVRVYGDPIPNAVLVQDVSIGTDLAGKYLLIVGKDNIVEKRQVEIGQLDNGMRVILKGIKPGEKYIAEGIQRARPGRPVTITNKQAPAGQQAKGGQQQKNKPAQQKANPATGPKKTGATPSKPAAAPDQQQN
ncbi:Efflux pump periplasmic linker BepF [Gimesia panareensis]|uniref:Efflux pump periplasmic linker BepF n=1 Tax=Gimesia panareensis TaxID=2527978 RepID=A0A517Q8F1_9PLAN|nr:efflux RND transporter periplasmic adaptor subunit [Gimesia panareensis]QDT27904.1 Efflux pump periplasmic linker BepF [Gimesia panareensis]